MLQMIYLAWLVRRQSSSTYSKTNNLISTAIFRSSGLVSVPREMHNKSGCDSGFGRRGIDLVVRSQRYSGVR
jgi:hypothetical protein